MTEFFAILLSLLTQPWSLVPWVLFVGWTTLGAWRYGRYARILADLERTEPGQRRYRLERRYEIYPGTVNKPMSFVRGRRTRWIVIATSGCLVMVAALLGVAAEQTYRSEEAQLTMNVLAVSPHQFGYQWKIRLENTGKNIAEIQSVRLAVASRARHSETGRKRPRYDRPRNSPNVVRVTPKSTGIPIVSAAGEITIGPGLVRTISFEIEANHEPHEGWIYIVTPEVNWNLAGSSRLRKVTGQSYRLGWPGLPHWSEPEALGGDANRAVVDDTEILGPE